MEKIRKAPGKLLHVPGVGGGKESAKARSSSRAAAEDKQRFEKTRLALSEAVEAHDVRELRRAIPLATAAGVSFKEIDAAKRILDFELNKITLQEVNDVRSAIESLAEAVDKLESRAATMEKSAPSPSKTDAFSKAKEMSDTDAEAWLTKMVQNIEERVWEALENRVEEQVAKAVDKAVTKLKDASAMKNSSKARDSQKVDMAKPAASCASALLPAAKDEARSAAPTLGTRRLSKNVTVMPPNLSESFGASNAKAQTAEDKTSEPQIEEPPKKKRKPVEETSMKNFFSRYSEDQMRKILSGDGSVIDDTLGSLIKDMPAMLEQPHNWGIRVTDVTRFYTYIRQDLLGYVKQEQDLGEDFAENLHVVTPRFIKPWTLPYSPAPLAAVINAENLCQNKFSSLEQIMSAKIFISHCWNENFGDFVKTLTRMLQPEDVVWICAISICQNVDIQEILGDSIEESPFWRAMPHCKRVAMLIDRKAEPFERAWCALEEYLATYLLRLPFSICMPDTMDEEAWKAVDQKLQNFSIRECKASQESDKKKIMDIIADKAEIIDRVVRHESEKACFAARVMKVAVHGTVEDLKPLAFQCLGHITDGAGRSMVHVLAQHDCSDMLTALLKNHIALDTRDSAGKSPLHLAVMGGYDGFAELLIENRADVNLKDLQGSTPLMTAALWGKAEVGRRLFKAGANPDTEDNLGYAPLLNASVYGHTEVVQLLLDQRANMYAKDPLGHCALTMAAQSGKDSVINCLIGNGAPIDERDGDGCTALMYASAFGHKKVVEELLGGKADPNVKDNEGWTALNFAKDEDKEECLELLEEFLRKNA